MFDVNDILKDVTGLTDEQKTLLQSTLTNPAVNKRLEEGQMRQSDYSRQIAEAQDKIKKATDYYNELAQWKQTEAQRLEAERQALGLGTGRDAGAGGGDPEYLSKEDFQKRLMEVETGAIGYLEALNQTSMQHYKEFGEILDVTAVRTKASQDQTNFAIAYERYIQPKRAEKAQAELAERIKREREEAAREALANASIPTGNATQGQGLNGGTPHVLDMIADKTRSYGWKVAAEAHTRDAMNGTIPKD